MPYAVSYQSQTTIFDLPFQVLGGQPIFESRALERFLSGTHVAVLAYLRLDGRPNQTPIWYTLAGRSLVMSTVTDSPKHRALERDPRVTVTIQDERPPYRAVIIEGEVSCTPIDLANNPTDDVDIRYLGRFGAKAYRRLTEEHYAKTGLTLLTLTPTAVKGFDNSAGLSRGELAFMRLRNRLPVPKGWL